MYERSEKKIEKKKKKQKKEESMIIYLKKNELILFNQTQIRFNFDFVFILHSYLKMFKLFFKYLTIMIFIFLK